MVWVFLPLDDELSSWEKAGLAPFSLAPLSLAVMTHPMFCASLYTNYLHSKSTISMDVRHFTTPGVPGAMVGKCGRDSCARNPPCMSLPFEPPLGDPCLDSLVPPLCLLSQCGLITCYLDTGKFDDRSQIYSLSEAILMEQYTQYPGLL